MKRMNKTLPFSMRLKPDLKADLQALADAENRNLTNFVETQLQRIRDEARANGRLAAGGKRK
jgi:predicted transcriptional regulator